MTNDFYTQIRREAFQSGVLLVVALSLFTSSWGFFNNDSTWWGGSALIFGLIAGVASLRSYPRFKVVVMKPDETMVEFLERVRESMPSDHVQVKKDTPPFRVKPWPKDPDPPKFGDPLPKDDDDADA